MGYRINYQTSGKVSRISVKRNGCQTSLKILCFCGILGVLLWTCWDEFKAAIWALDLMAAELGQGSSIREAITVFCLQVLHGA